MCNWIICTETHGICRPAVKYILTCNSSKCLRQTGTCANRMFIFRGISYTQGWLYEMCDVEVFFITGKSCTTGCPLTVSAGSCRSVVFTLSCVTWNNNTVYTFLAGFTDRSTNILYFRLYTTRILNCPQCQSRKITHYVGLVTKVNIVNVFNYESPTHLIHKHSRHKLQVLPFLFE